MSKKCFFLGNNTSKSINSFQFRCLSLLQERQEINIGIIKIDLESEGKRLQKQLLHTPHYLHYNHLTSDKKYQIIVNHIKKCN